MLLFFFQTLHSATKFSRNIPQRDIQNTQPNHIRFVSVTKIKEALFPRLHLTCLEFERASIWKSPDPPLANRLPATKPNHACFLLKTWEHLSCCDNHTIVSFLQSTSLQNVLHRSNHFCDWQNAISNWMINLWASESWWYLSTSSGVACTPARVSRDEPRILIAVPMISFTEIPSSFSSLWKRSKRDALRGEV